MNSKDYEKQILKYRDYSIKQFDKLIIFLSSGAIVISIGFINNVVNLKTEISKSLLIWSWTSFALSLISILISQKTSLITMNKELLEEKKCSNFYDKITDCLNWVALISLSIGIILLIIFISTNL